MFGTIYLGEDMYQKELKSLGYNIKKYRLLKGFTQEEFAEKIGKTSNYISLLENGHKGIHITTLFDIARALEIAPKELLEPCDVVLGKIKNYKKVYH